MHFRANTLVLIAIFLLFHPPAFAPEPPDSMFRDRQDPNVYQALVKRLAKGSSMPTWRLQHLEFLLLTRTLKGTEKSPIISAKRNRLEAIFKSNILPFQRKMAELGVTMQWGFATVIAGNLKQIHTFGTNEQTKLYAREILEVGVFLSPKGIRQLKLGTNKGLFPNTKFVRIQGVRNSKHIQYIESVLEIISPNKIETLIIDPGDFDGLLTPKDILPLKDIAERWDINRIELLNWQADPDTRKQIPRAITTMMSSSPCIAFVLTRSGLKIKSQKANNFFLDTLNRSITIGQRSVDLCDLMQEPHSDIGSAILK